MASRCLGFLCVFFLFVGMLAMATPNYLRATPIGDIFPFCAERFNLMIEILAGNIVGVFCASLFAFSILPILLALTPSLVRAAFLILHGHKGMSSMRTVRTVFIFSSLMTPLIMILPLIVFYQMFGDNVIMACLIIFLVLPPFIAIKFKINLTMYLVWMFVYLGSIGAMILYEVIIFEQLSSVVQILKAPDLYCELIAEVCIANVVLSDVLYVNLF